MVLGGKLRQFCIIIWVDMAAGQSGKGVGRHITERPEGASHFLLLTPFPSDSIAKRRIWSMSAPKVMLVPIVRSNRCQEVRNPIRRLGLYSEKSGPMVVEHSIEEGICCQLQALNARQAFSALTFFV